MTAFLVDGARPGAYVVVCDEQHCDDYRTPAGTLPDAQAEITRHDRDDHADDDTDGA